MAVLVEPVPKLQRLPVSLSGVNAVEIELEEGVLIFRASVAAQNRIEDLLLKQKERRLDEAEEKELQEYEEIDDYLSFLNRLTRNLAQPNDKGVSDAA